MKKIIYLCYLIFSLFGFLSILLLLQCSPEPTQPSDNGPINLTGGWLLTSTVTSNTCGMVNGSTNTEEITLIQCGNAVTVITENGLWGSGTISNDRLEFTGSEILTDSSGCISTRVSTGSLIITSNQLDGSFTTEITYDPNTCGSQSPCSVMISADIRLSGLYLSNCIDRDNFGDPSQSEYILPWLINKAYVLNNSYCFPLGGHREQMAYDFLIPIGDTILASRSGIVRLIKETSPDNGQGTDHNHVFIEHSDGTVGFYAHLKQWGVFVNVGDIVVTGQPIALAGHSGTTDVVHLHFGVYSTYPPSEGNDRAINFRNTTGKLDCKGGLIRGESYKAIPY